MISEDNIFSVVDNVLRVMLHFECEPMTEQHGDEFPLGSNDMIGQVEIKGLWNGKVRFMVTKNFACKAASKMLMMDSETLAEQDIADTITELTNMIGGNIKTLLPSPSSLSLPCIDSSSNEGSYLTPNSRVKKILCDQEPLMVVLTDHA